jgi:hypothetical protein
LRAPAGYLDRGRGNPKEIDPIQGPLVRQTFELYATGTYPFHKLRSEMYARGLRGHGGNAVSLNGLTTILNNPFYMGLIRIRKSGELFEGVHAPLVSKALFEKVQAVLRGHRISKPYKHDYLYRRLIRCSGCERSLVGERAKNRYTYYRCHTRGCPGACVPEASIDRAVRDYLKPLQFDEKEIGDIRDLVGERSIAATNERAERADAIKLLIGKCDDRIARLTDALIDGLIDKDTFDLRNAAILSEKRGHKDRLDGVAFMPLLAERIEKNLQLANTAYLSYENGNPSEQRDLLQTLTSNFSGTEKSPAITLVSPFQELWNFRKSHRCDPCRDEPRTHAMQIFSMFEAAAVREDACAAVPNERRSPTARDIPDVPHVPAASFDANTGGFQKPV